VTQLIARRVREAGVYSEIAPFTTAEEAFERLKPKGIIFSGSPAGVPEEGSPRAPIALFESGLPILGICYGQQVMTHQLGGEVRPGHETGEGGEFGRAFLTVTEGVQAVRRPVAGWRAAPGVDEPRRQGDSLRRRLPHRRHQRRCAVPR
jgi:GMP synthase-like glutamine amidotransferase